jgi:hypothetical protein
METLHMATLPSPQTTSKETFLNGRLIKVEYNIVDAYQVILFFQPA